MHNIQISTETYSRLEKLAQGFDTPESVIIRLLDNHINNTEEAKPTITFSPSDENLFKNELIKRKEAEVVLYKIDGSREIHHWNATKISEKSNLRANLWSGFLRDWKQKGIKYAELNILPMSNNFPDDNTEELKTLALALGLTFSEIEQLDYNINPNESNDGLVYGYIIQFQQNANEDILRKISGLNEHLSIQVGNIF